jgi:hypothetical protein
MGRPKGSRNKTAVERFLKRANLPTVAQQAEYLAQIKPGQRDLTDRFVRIQEAIEQLAALKRIKQERSEHPDMQDVPGGKTGMIVFTWVKHGDGYSKVSRFDGPLDAAISNHLVYISRELGQFQPGVEVTIRPDGSVGEKAAIDYSCLSN